jgi:integrase/recombinase XerD
VAHKAFKLIILGGYKMSKDIYNYMKKLTVYENKLEREDILQENKDTIREFKQYLVLKNYSLPRMIKYYEILISVCRTIPKSFKDFTKNDILTIIEDLHARELRPATITTYSAIIKRFFKWHTGNDEEYPALVKNLKTTLSKSKIKLPNEGDFITEEEVKKLLDTAKNPRDKALVALLWETGARISEIANSAIRDITFDKYGGFITVLGKTGSRKVRIISSIPYIAAWLEYHPCKSDPNSNLFVGYYNGQTRGKNLHYRAFHKVLRDLFINSGIKKKSNPHSFRHARATHLANHLTEFQMNQYFGWAQGSDMPSIYVHLSGKNTDDSLLKLHGLKKDETAEKKSILSKHCVRCRTINQHNAKFCVRCACVMDARSAADITSKEEELEKKQDMLDKYFGKLLEDNDFKQMMMEKIAGMQEETIKTN